MNTTRRASFLISLALLILAVSAPLSLANQPAPRISPKPSPSANPIDPQGQPLDALIQKLEKTSKSKV
jgi:hypothetical protein